MPFPSGQPNWQVVDLQQLAMNNQLFGVSPLVLSGIGQNESGWEVRGAGVNPQGYGGFYGLGVNSKYSYGGSTFQDTSAELHDPSEASFKLQSETAAAEVASLLHTYGGDLNKAISAYVSGGPGDLNNQDYKDVISALGGATAAGPDTTSPSNNTGAPGGAPGNATLAAQTSQPTTTPAKPQQTGVAGILQDIDGFLNPHITSTGGNLPIIGSILQVPGDIESTILEIAGRGLFTLFFLAITLGGVYLMVRKPANVALSLVNPIQRAQRISQEGQRLSVSQAAERRRYATAGLQDPF